MRSRTKILRATLDLIEQVGFEGVTIVGAAQAAGVSRQTVYSIFGSREELVSQAIGDLAVRALDGIRSRLEGTQSPAGYLAELVVAGRTVVREDPVLAVLLRSERANPVFDDGMMTRATPVAHTLLAPLFARYPDLDAHARDIAEMTILLGLSVVLFDDEKVHSDDALRGFLMRWIEPAVSRFGGS